MTISQLMSRDVVIASPDDTLIEVAQTMREQDIGSLPVGAGDRLVGMVTDRDIAVRGVAAGLGPDAAVREVMSEQVLYCFEDDEPLEVSMNMADNRLRRLPVLDRDKRLVGIVALADIAGGASADSLATAAEGVSRPGGPHNQSVA